MPVDLFDAFDGFAGEDMEILDYVPAFYLLIKTLRGFSVQAAATGNFVKSHELLHGHV